MLPAFATLEQLAARVPGGITEGEEARAQAALDDASAKIRIVGRSWVDDEDELVEDLPDIVTVVCLSAALRVLIGVYAEGRSNPSTDVYLTAQERRQIRKAAGIELGVQTTTRGPLETHGRGGYPGDTVYVETDSGSPIPYTDSDGY